MTPLIIVIVVVVLIVMFVIGKYNGLIRLRNNRENAFADIDVQLGDASGIHVKRDNQEDMSKTELPDKENLNSCEHTGINKMEIPDGFDNMQFTILESYSLKEEHQEGRQMKTPARDEKSAVDEISLEDDIEQKGGDCREMKTTTIESFNKHIDSEEIDLVPGQGELKFIKKGF